MLLRWPQPNIWGKRGSGAVLSSGHEQELGFVPPHDLGGPQSSADRHRPEDDLSTSDVEVSLLPWRRQKILLLDLPLEIVLHILKKCDPKTLLGLRLVSKALGEPVQALLRSRSFERHLVQLFISVLLHGGEPELMRYFQENLETFHISVVPQAPDDRTRRQYCLRRTTARRKRKWPDDQKWYLGTKICSSPSCVNADDLSPALPHGGRQGYVCMSTRLMNLGYLLEEPPSSLNEGLVRAFGPKYLVKLFYVLLRQIKDILRTEYRLPSRYPLDYPPANLSKDQASTDNPFNVPPFDEEMLQRHEAAFAIESIQDHKLECDKSKKELSGYLSNYDKRHQPGGLCAFDCVMGAWCCPFGFR